MPDTDTDRKTVLCDGMPERAVCAVTSQCAVYGLYDDLLHGVGDARAECLDIGFFHRPDAGEKQVGGGSVPDGSLFFRCEYPAEHAFFHVPQALGIHTAWSVGQKTGGKPFTMAQAEMQLRVCRKIGLSCCGALHAGNSRKFRRKFREAVPEQGMGSSMLRFRRCTGRTDKEHPQRFRERQTYHCRGS